MKKKRSNVSCPGCGYTFLGQMNLFGKICTRCYEYIPPLRELPIVEQNKFKRDMLIAELREYLTKKFNESNEGNNADFN
jgi:hypothetical protein